MIELDTWLTCSWEGRSTETFFVGVLRGNTIRGNRARNSERKMVL